MAIQCKYCGTELPKEDARFCNNCGMLVPSHPFSPESLSAVRNGSKMLSEPSFASEVNPVELEKVDPVELSEPSVAQDEVVQEKLPQTPKPDSLKRTVPPSRVAYKQISPLVSPRRIPGVRRKMPGAAQMSPETLARPEPVMQVSVKEPVAPEDEPLEDEPLEEQNKAAAAPALFQSKAGPAREFHVAVWGDEEMRKLSNAEEQAIEDVPTRSVAVPSVEDLAKQAGEAPVEDVPTQIVEAPIEDVPTQAIEVSVDDLPTQLLAVPAAPAAPFASSPSYQPVNVPLGNMPQEERIVAGTSPARKARRRWPIVLVVLLLVVLVVGGVGAVLVLSQQSSADPLLQPQVSFSNSQLGIALLYPNGWIQQVEVAQSAAHFYASNHVGEVDIIVTSGGGDVKQALQQQATKMGLSSIKTAAVLNFGGASWQQLRGTLQVSGANYTDTLLATSQGGKLFLMVQQAPQNNYADWDKEFFVPLRASFKFV